MAAPTIPGSSTQAVNTVGSTQNFTVQWWNFFAGLLAYVTAGPLGPVPIAGFSDGSNAAAGVVGEYLSSFRLSGAAVNLPNITDVQITSLALTAGDWDLWGEIYFARGSGTLGGVTAAINTTVNSSPTVPADGVDQQVINGLSAVDPVSLNGVRTRVSITTPTTYLLVARVSSTGTTTGYGALRARRMR